MHRHHFFFRAMGRGFRDHDHHGQHRYWHGPQAGPERDDMPFFGGRRGPFDRMGGADFFAEWADGLRGGGRRGGGRMFGHGDLKLLLLALIEQQPRHGYELIRTIEEMFHGQYSPSPGAVYPTLTMLEELGHAKIDNEQGGRKLYAITDDGRAFLDQNRPAVDAVMNRTEESARMAARMSLPTSIRHAMHALKHALLMRGGEWNATETQRVADILERAAGEIATGRHRE
ncbi:MULTISPECIES: PadR family transcriptional regulator [Dyella]|uniref:PadR family transcriptional regulator n=2 Tax=Dyella TaxID=231454 RepID=A0A4V2NMA5_9GAMM|nr:MULTISPECIES: PadR family transcriptional regulator [Dyella]TBR39853.1 PadR family transcriptional regulator [Dyella terrae]TCI12567.1 PadR family transcriptional regulator [Dyella soli]